MFDLICAGGTHQDVVARALDDIRRDDSNKAVIRNSWGGVALNVARAVAGDGLTCRLVVPSLEICDEIEQYVGRSGLYNLLQPASLGVLDMERVTYLAIEHSDGSLLTGAIDDRGYDFVDDGVLCEQLRKEDGRMWFLDANYPANVLESVAQMEDRPPLALDCVSVEKAKKLRQTVGIADFIFGNREEIECLLDQPNLSKSTVIITNGTQPVTILAGDDKLEVPVQEVTQASVNGAGDALIGGTLSGLLKGNTIAHAVENGVAVSKRHITARNP